MPFDRYPAVDENLEFSPDVNRANMPLVLTTSQRDAISAARKWDGRQIYNSTLKRYQRWDAAAATWRTIADQQDLSTITLATTTPNAHGTAAVGTGTTAARADHVHPKDVSPVIALSARLTASQSIVQGDWRKVVNWGSFATIGTLGTGIRQTATGSGVFALDVGGYFAISMTGNFSVSNGLIRAVRIMASGASMAEIRSPIVPSPHSTGMTIYYEGRFAAATTIEFHAYQDGTSSLNLLAQDGAGNTVMSIRRIDV